MDERSPAQVYALVFGVILVGAGVAGFFYSSDFGEPGEVDTVFDILAVNGWHNVVHIATGVLGLAVAGSYIGSRNYAIGLGAVYIGVAIWGFVIGDGESILSIIPVNTEDNFLHVLIGVAGLSAGLLTPAAPPPTTVPPEPA